jgi:TfoX/Sxy family transcriptional regulator of competence genes
VPYDDDLANRLRELLGADPTIAERKMFGGLVFLLNGNMSVSASRRGGLLVRVDPRDAPKLLERPHVETMHMRGRSMANFLYVAPEAVRTKRQLASWVKRSVDFAATLPPKR